MESRPYSKISRELDISEEQAVGLLQKLKAQGVVRRYGAVLKHQKAGFTENAMVAWKVDCGDADRIGQIMASYRQISHCYLREVPEDFPYPLFTMIHARSKEELEDFIKYIAAHSGIKEYISLKSIKELKKTSMKYY